MLDDVLDDLTTIAAAERDYGVVIDADTMTIDEAATAQRRSGATAPAAS